MRELHHHLDQYLASLGLALAQSGDHDSLVFHTRDDVWMGASHMADGRLRLFACPGHASADWLQDLREDSLAERSDFVRDPFDQLERDVVVRWWSGAVEWSVAVERLSGAVTLSLLMADGPRQPDDWDRCLERFEQQFEVWRDRLQDEAPPLAQDAAHFTRLLSAGHLLPA